MARPSKTQANKGSLKRGTGKTAFWAAFDFVWDTKAQAFFLKDSSARKRFGPFQNIAEVREDHGFEFVLDGGALARAEEAEVSPASVA